MAVLRSAAVSFQRTTRGALPGISRTPSAAAAGLILYALRVTGLRQDVIDGEIDRVHDLEALEVAPAALSCGYSAIVHTWLEAMVESPAI